MSDMLERAKTHYKAMCNDIRVIEVPEWADSNGEPARIYVYPPTLADLNAVYKVAKDESLEAIVSVILTRARDNDGTRLFHPKDKPALMASVSSTVLSRIAEEINKDLSDDYSEAAEKN